MQFFDENGMVPDLEKGEQKHSSYSGLLSCNGVARWHPENNMESFIRLWSVDSQVRGKWAWMGLVRRHWIIVLEVRILSDWCLLSITHWYPGYLTTCVFIHVFVCEMKYLSRQNVCFNWVSFHFTRVNHSEFIAIVSGLILHIMIVLRRIWIYQPQKKYSDDSGKWVITYHEHYKRGLVLSI